MRRIRNRIGLSSVIATALLVFGWVHFSEKVRGVVHLGRTVKMQNEEISRMKASIERIQTLKSLQVDLRLKLFGGDAQAVSEVAYKSSGRPLSGELLAAMRKANVEFASFDPSQGGGTLRFWGRYPDVSHFLAAAEAAFPRIDRFSIETSKNGGVLLSLTVPGGSL